jgi:signal transduction histidine kinase
VPDRTPRVRASIFARMLTIMIIMAVTLLLIVGFFFVFVVFPGATAEAGRAFEQYSEAIAATSPDLQAAKAIAHRLSVQIRYEGPRGSWTTADYLPLVREVREGKIDAPIGHNYYLEPSTDGGSYLFAWDYSRHVRDLHAKMLWLLLFLVTGVVCTAYAFQKRLLRPVRLLDDGVERLSKGDLNVAVPVLTRDEFGALTDAFNKMVGRVRQMVQARDQLLLDVSHELRSPLTRLKVALALLPDDENHSGMVGDLNEMEAMIAELLEMERLRDGRGIRREMHDLVSVAQEVAENYRKGPPGIRIVSPLREVWLDIDKDKIKTVLRNLLDNAVKFGLPDSRAIEVDLEQNALTVTLLVCDDGTGIPPADIANLFEPFYRVDRSRSKKTGGYGLGLSICKRIMEAHGGSIAVTNNPGRGASFVLSFPKTACG